MEREAQQPPSPCRVVVGNGQKIAGDGVRVSGRRSSLCHRARATKSRLSSPGTWVAKAGDVSPPATRCNPEIARVSRRGGNNVQQPRREVPNRNIVPFPCLHSVTCLIRRLAICSMRQTPCPSVGIIVSRHPANPARISGCHCCEESATLSSKTAGPACGNSPLR